MAFKIPFKLCYAFHRIPTTTRPPPTTTDDKRYSELENPHLSLFCDRLIMGTQPHITVNFAVLIHSLVKCIESVL